jgi:hypothetical protein
MNCSHTGNLGHSGGQASIQGRSGQMSVNYIDLVALKVFCHLGDGNRVDFCPNVEGSVFPPKTPEVFHKGFALKGHKLDIVTSMSLRFRKRHHAMDGAIDHIGGARNVGNPQTHER